MNKQDIVNAVSEFDDQKRIVTAFHRLYYNDQVWANGRTRWLGIPVAKAVTDLFIYQELLYKIQPEVIIECGAYLGGSALYMATILDCIGKGTIISIDIQDHGIKVKHPRIRFELGRSSTDRDTLYKVREFVGNKSPVMVILDSDHRAEHVLNELNLYSPYVTSGSYLICEDTNINNIVALDSGPGPAEAVREFLGTNTEFYVDKECEKFFLTFNVSGYLRRK